MPTGLSIGFRCRRTVSSGTTQYGYVTCGHGCKDSEDGYVYEGYGNAANKTNPKGKVFDATFSGSVDASYIKRLSKEIKIGAKTNYDAAGNIYGDKLKRDSYRGSIPEGRVVYKCGATTYKTSGTVSHNTYNSTLSDVAFRNCVRVEEEFSKKGDSGGIVYTYASGEYWPCGIISSGVGQAPIIVFL